MEKEESLDVAGEVVQGLLDLAFSLGQEHYLEEEAFSYTVEEARLSLLQIIEVTFHLHVIKHPTYLCSVYMPDIFGSVKCTYIDYKHS